MTAVRLGTGAFRIEDLVAVAIGRAKVAPAQDVLDRLATARRVLDGAAAAGQRIYGLNTGLGAKVGLDLSHDPAAFQDMLVQGRAIGVGLPLSIEAVRATMGARCAMLAQGGSGISVHAFLGLCALLDAGVHPIVPRHGSLGAGDLGLLAHIALVLIGQGHAEHGGDILSGDAALRRAGLTPVRLAPKDGLSLINASAVSVGCGALLVHAVEELLAWQERAAALGFAAVRGNRGIFEPAIQTARPAAGQSAAAARMRDLLDSTAYEPAALQDPLSFRCLAPITGALAEAAGRARAEVETELNSAADNPLVREDAGIQSTGNFATPSLALAFENLGLAMAQAAQAGVARFVHLSSGSRAGLPRALTKAPGAAAGFVPLQKTAMALLADIRRQAAPVMLDYWPVSEGVEDHATQSPLVVEKAHAMMGAWRHLVAIELLAAAQAADLQAGVRLGGPLAALRDAVRVRVGLLHADRPLAHDVKTLHDWIAADPPPPV